MKPTRTPYRPLVLFLLVGFIFPLGATFGQEADSEEGVRVTVYNSDLAVVKDRRSLEVPEGIGKVSFTDVAKRIDATSVHFESLTDPKGTSVLEQNYEYDLVGPSKLLDKYLDREVTLFTKNGEVFTGTLLSQSEGKITLRNEEGKLLVLTGGENLVRVELANLPEGLITKPTLVWETFSKTGGSQLCQVTYMTGGINWKADYVLVVSDTDDQVDLTGWVTLNNQSGATYKNALLKLIAGDVNRVQPAPMPAKLRRGVMAMALADEAAPAFEEKSFFEYHLYTLQRPTTIREAQIKQVSLLSANDAPAEKVFTYNGSRNAKKVEVRMEFENSEENNMGMPLPKGLIRAFKQDSDGSLEFVGEDSIDHTPKDEKVRVLLGNAFDLVGERKATDHKTISQRVREDSYEIELRNHKEEAVTIKVVEPMYGDWKITNSSHPFIKKNAQTLEFEIEVPADGGTVVTYTARIVH